MDTITWPTTHGDRVEVYPAANPWTDDFAPALPDVWRYRVVARNNRVVETGSESYTRRAAAIKAAERHHPRVES